MQVRVAHGAARRHRERPGAPSVEENQFWLALADSDALLYAKGVAAFAGLDVDIQEADVAPMQIQGPKSKDVIRALFGDRVADLQYYCCAEAEVDGIPVVVSRTGWTGEVGFEIYLRDTSRGDELWRLVEEAGSPFGIRAIAPSEARRIEAGIFNYGSDIRPDDTPFHVSGLEKYVELDQEQDFIGQAALERMAEDGVDRKLVGIDIGGAPMTDEGALERLLACSDATDRRRGRRHRSLPRGPGRLGSRRTSGTHGFRPRTWPSAPPSTLESHAGPRPATVPELPFVDPKKEIPKS